MRTIEEQRQVTIKLINEYMDKVSKDIRAMKDTKRGGIDSYPNRRDLESDLTALKVFLSDYELLKIMNAANDGLVPE